MIYEPAEDSRLLQIQVRKYAGQKTVLDMGTGSGIQALEAKKAGAKSILASDIDPKSVSHVKSLGIEVIESDLFSKIGGCFDLIIFNPPYLPKDDREDEESARITTGGEKGDEIVLSFLKQSILHMNEGGIILILLSSLTPLNRIKNLIKQLKFKYQELSSTRSFFEELFVWKIEKA